jgi:predicted ATPase
MRLRWKTLRREQSAADLSDGTLRFLLMLAILASPEAAPVIAIDEPETGLHPSMLPIIAEYAAEASSSRQIVFTTHSPQFLDAFRDVRPTTTVAKWENGETKLATLDGKGLEKWLKEYSLGALCLSGELEGMA